MSHPDNLKAEIQAIAYRHSQNLPQEVDALNTLFTECLIAELEDVHRRLKPLTAGRGNSHFEGGVRTATDLIEVTIKELKG